jgi:hypothetical protein
VTLAASLVGCSQGANSREGELSATPSETTPGASAPASLPNAGGAGPVGASSGGAPSSGGTSAAIGGAPTGASGGAAGAPVAAGPGPVTEHGALQVVGSELHGASGLSVQLRGQAFAWDNWWPQYYNADAVAWLRNDWCVDVVRASMGIEPEGAYLTDPTASVSRIRTVVEAAIANDLYVIIDWHAHDLHPDEAVAFFADMASSYGTNPHVIYEVFNEPDEETWPEVKSYAETVLATIRQHDPDNLVIVGCPEWDQRIDLVAADPITTDPNVIYAVHFYAATHTAWLRDRTQDAILAGIPVIISESGGSEASGMGANDYEQWQAWFDFMDEHQLSWINWSVSDKAGETVSVLEPRAPVGGGWDASHLTETGEHIRDVFLSYCE